jgi:hypothetical protein
MLRVTVTVAVEEEVAMGDTGRGRELEEEEVPD